MSSDGSRALCSLPPPEDAPVLDPLQAAPHLKFPLNSPCHVLSFRAKNPTRLGTAGGKILHFWGEEEGVGPAASGTQCWANIPAGCQGKE